MEEVNERKTLMNRLRVNCEVVVVIVKKDDKHISPSVST